MDHLDFSSLREINIARCNDVFHPIESWSPTDWGNALAGEVGETCNKLKKLRRGEHVSMQSIAEELADVVIYADLLAARLGIDLAHSVIDKFNEVSLKRGSEYFLKHDMRA